MKQFTIILLIASLLLCCTDTVKEFSEPGSEVIDKLGKYELKSVGYVFSMTKQDTLIRAELLNKDGELVSSLPEGTQYHRYFFVWDKENKRLWYNNTDVGVGVWIFGDEEVELVNMGKKDAAEYVPMMPLNFFEALPSTLQRLWKEHRTNQK